MPTRSSASSIDGRRRCSRTGAVALGMHRSDACARTGPGVVMVRTGRSAGRHLQCVPAPPVARTSRSAPSSSTRPLRAHAAGRDANARLGGGLRALGAVGGRRVPSGDVTARPCAGWSGPATQWLERGSLDLGEVLRLPTHPSTSSATGWCPCSTRVRPPRRAHAQRRAVLLPDPPQLRLDFLDADIPCPGLGPRSSGALPRWALCSAPGPPPAVHPVTGARVPAPFLPARR